MDKRRNSILLAEDCEDDGNIFKEIVKLSPYANPITVVRTGEEAIAYLIGEGAYADRSKFPLPTVFITNLRLPKMNGFAVLRWVRGQPRFRDLFVVVMSGRLKPKKMRQAYRLGANSFLIKPLDRRELENLAVAHKEYWT